MGQGNSQKQGSGQGSKDMMLTHEVHLGRREKGGGQQRGKD